MDWRLKCLAFHMLRLVPGSLYSIAQRRVTGRYFLSVTDAILAAYGFHVQNFRGGRALEFGSGSNLLTPLLLSAAGAVEVLAYDIQAIATVERINHVIRQLRGRVAGDWPTLASLADLMPLYRIRYCAPGDARNTELPAASVDFFCSTSTLEHIPAPDIALILRECRRIATPSAVFSFAIDYHDHYATGDPGITRFNFYRYGDAVWRLCNPAMHFQNRLRHCDYERLFAEQGMVATLNRRVIPADSPHDFGDLAPPFRGYARDDLAALNGLFVLAANPA